MRDAIKKLLKEKNAIMLAHNYQPPEIQDLADMCGDSLELSIRAADTDAEVIVFCGVHFMAETASIISPDKTVLLPRHDAGCLMADMINAESLEAKKARMAPMPVVTYVNSTAEVKALSTICCTSANVVKVVNSLPEKEMLLAPDRNLAMYAASKTNKTIHVWDGYCPTHEWLTAADAAKAKADHPDAVFMAHPECRPDVLVLADVVESTSGMLRYASQSPHKAFIVGTETGLLHPMQKQNPDKTFYPASKKMVCRNMKRIGMSDVALCLENLSGQVKVPEDIRIPALAAVTRMLDLSR
ncbi:quinolinate synthase NadA [Desulfosarcina sp.]|uniref:quinolinate synthase NadA n=1 Tax=Desulfosarcina sp. TaxID=2027861 RepID=UPI0029BC776A|nr:quinolinate synthase NadA [Desulfosarcina sp.]MDX2454655.1 quinolinate synthase NadA [Desulfosarcina sp.]MDX2492279.1 quinolinate synthase NadA [Desulfosarcina sp.]